MPATRLRWTTTDEAPALPGLEERVTHPEFQGLEFLHVRAKRLLNEVPAAASLPFRWTINVYRGCSHDCSYCQVPDTPILMADGRVKRIADLRVGDRVLGTTRRGRSRRYVKTEVKAHWSTTCRAYRITLVDGTELVASADHRYLTRRGWKHVTGADQSRDRRAHLTLNDELLGTGQFAPGPKPDGDYPRGYLCGLLRGDASIGRYAGEGDAGGVRRVSRFRLALCDEEALDRARYFLEDAGIDPVCSLVQSAGSGSKELHAIRCQARGAVEGDVEAIEELISWPSEPSETWYRGFLAGIFDAEGNYSGRTIGISNSDDAILDWTLAGLRRFGFDAVVEDPERPARVRVIRVRGGLREHLRFFHTVEPAITRKRTIVGTALKPDARLRVVSVEDLGLDVPMYDITTGTGDFIANGVVSHNCFARPSHAWLELDPAKDFGRVIVVKVNAVERLRAELRAPSWAGEHIALGTNTDPYQRCEGRYRLTRGVVSTLAEAGNSFSVLTKGTLVTRDLDVFAEAAARGVCTGVSLSIPTLDEDLWRASEPGTPHPRARMEAVARLAEAGIPAGVMVAPIIPGLSDAPAQLEAVVRAAVGAGASSITPIVLHLRPGVKEVFADWLGERRPDLVARYERLYAGSYAPKEVRAQIAGTVRRLVDRHGGTRPATAVTRGRAGTTPRAGTPARASRGDENRHPAAEQLGLL